MKFKFLLFVLIFFVGIFCFYYFYKAFYLEKPSQIVPQTPIDVTQTPTNSLPNVQTKTLKEGTFNKIDFAHYANGQAQIILKDDMPLLQLKNFSTNPNGPDLFVYLSKGSGYKNLTDGPGEFVSLGKLKSLTSDSVYNLPSNYDEYNSVLIWCRAFSILFSAADF